MSENKKEKKPKTQDIIIGLGEATGHKHMIPKIKSTILKKDASGCATDFVIHEGSEVVHDEHDKIALNPDRYIIGTVQVQDHTQDLQRPAVD